MNDMRYAKYAIVTIIFASLISVAPNFAYSQAGQLTVNVDKTTYGAGETIKAKGTVPAVLEGVPVAIQVFNPRNTMYTIGQTTPSSDGMYSFDFKIGGKLGIDGIYTVKSTYSGQSVQTTFEFVIESSTPTPTIKSTTVKFENNVFNVETDPVTGEAKVAQCGLRRIEGALLKEYKRDDVFIAQPDVLDKAIGPDTKVVGINVMDPLGMAPVTTTMSPEMLSYVAMKFKRMCAKIIQLKKQYKFKVLVGGNGAWELAKPDRMRIHGLDTVVVGEADELALDIFKDAENGDIPELLHTFVRTIDNIPEITGPTVNSLIEAMRGCGRGCDFCDVNKRSKKDFPLERLQREAKINLDYGFDSIWLQSDEMLLYGCDSKDFQPNKDAILELWKGLKSTGARFVGTTHMTLSAVTADPDLIQKMSDINGMSNSKWLSTNLGVETVSPKLVKKHLGVKTKPFQPEEWGSVVREGCRILNENHWFPALTLIIGWPDETPEDTQYTIDLVEDLSSWKMKGLLAPLLYQDYSEKNSMHFGNLNESQFTLFWRCWENNLRVINDIIPIIVRNKSFGPMMKVFMAMLIKAGTWAIMRYLRGICKELFDQTPDDIISRYTKKSITMTIKS